MITTVNSALFFFSVVTTAGLPVSAADLIRCPDAASLVAIAAPASAAPKADFAGLVAPRAPGPGTSAGATPAPVSTAPLDPLGIFSGANGTTRATATAKPTAAPSGGTPSQACAYVIRSGDTLGRIATAKLGSANRWSDIQAANPGLNPNALVPGRQIALPCSGVAAELAAAPTAVVAPAPVILPTWTARSGEFFSDVVKRWAKTEGYSVIFSTTADWRLAVSVSEQGSFEEVLDRLAKGLGANGRPPFIQLFPNKVLKIGGGA